MPSQFVAQSIDRAPQLPAAPAHDPDRIREAVAGAFAFQHCGSHVRTAGTGFQFYCFVHDAYSPVRDTHALAAADQCPMLTARFVSQDNWLDGVKARLRAETAGR